MVSVSGSSGTLGYFGTARQLAPADVGAVLLALESGRRGELLALLARFLHRLSQARHGEYASAGGDQIARRVAPRSGVKEQHVIRRRWNFYAIPGTRLLRISA